MEKLHFTVVFAVFFIAVMAAEIFAYPLLSAFIADDFLAKKFALACVYLSLIAISLPAVERLSGPRCRIVEGPVVVSALGLGIAMAVLDYCLTGAQVFLVAQVSKDAALGFWNFIPTDDIWGQDDRYLGLSSGTLKVATFICLQSILGPVAEELIFRGMIFRNLKFRYKSSVAVVLSSLLFTVIHPINQYLSTFVFSILITHYYSRTKNVIGISIIHGTVNLVLWLGSGFGAITYLKSHDPATLGQPSSWSPELVGVAILLPVVALAIRRLTPPAASTTASTA